MPESVNFLGLLHVAGEPAAHVNLPGNGAAAIDVYLKCAALCSASIDAQGGRFALITNSPDTLQARCRQLGLDRLSIVGHAFRWKVPPGSRFYSAHFKLELIEAFGSGRFGDRVALIDIDTVLLRRLELPALAAGAIAAYDISAQVIPAYGSEVIRRDLALIAGRDLPAPRWFGGECICSDAAGYAHLARHVAECWPRYLQSIDSLHHIGDEAVMSAALNLLSAEHGGIHDAGGPGGVARWWTSRTLAPQLPFSAISDRSLLHLPADKPFLAAYPNKGFDSARFIAAYRRYARRRLFAQRGYSFIGALLHRRRDYVTNL